ncbi:Putative Mce family protein [Mycobacteroides abscessus subsp. massiliense]|uniref:Mce related family protein n=1 Tax=Mycobacteroides abscessus subsp. bolletii 1513 TaxID=1299321 RepID=X8DF99_9MYCO|nr:MlaD family protein [Mycobacteroides abscessus]EUA67267.1 mce related family protein [Mycobacteroides abscessus subsp. bolletii 1513]EIU04350.1 mce family protein Mce5F [Mycobacteroides abscessus 5S-0422]EIU08241.1 mce family protein Mce5F [Mycobacteroides abscessus 5S-0421]EIU10491.1 mce family protein Mce5F [Mycobacteroides abscessus 5S-0304]EIU22870.1 mce family protein Mce5F [Mycobacteroides abscessus 5S-0708]
MIDAVANAVVAAVRAGHRQKSTLSTLALVLTLVLAVTYLCVGALRANPFASTYRVTVKLSESGGLLPRQDVALRGVKIGTVQSLRITPQGVEATAEILSKYKIPAAARVRVTGLSPAGEQYINFEGTPGQQGPYLSDGSVIAEGVQVPVTLAKLLADADGVLAQVDPKKLELIKKELGLTKEGPRKLTEIIDGGTFLLSTLDSVLPETTSILKNSRVVLTLAADKNAGIKATADSLGRTLRGVEKMQNGYRTLIDQTPKTLSAVDNLFSDNSDTMVQLLASLATTSQMLYVRTPAINAFFPNYRGSTFGAIADTMRDNGIWVTADLYPRYACDYGTPRVPPSSADFPEPPVYTYCADDDPAVLIRGAKNAPRPAGDDTAGPPPGADLGKKTDPTPKGRFTIPTPPGGPTLPIEPPR